MLTPTIDPAIYLFRHGETEWNRQSRRQGHLDSPLTERGRRQASENAKRFKCLPKYEEKVNVFASPLGRARHTAKIVCQELQVPEEEIVFEPALMECSFGLWEGLTAAEIKSLYPKEWRARSIDRWTVPPPLGESYADVHARVFDWFENTPITQTTLIVCHGLTSRVLRGVYAGLSQRDVFEMCEPQEGFFELRNRAILHIK